MSALIIVDVQNDFVDGLFALKNSPAKQDGLDVIPVINDLLTTIKFDCVVYTQDWHPSNHISFFENVHSRKFFMNGVSIICISIYEIVLRLIKCFESFTIQNLL